MGSVFSLEAYRRKARAKTSSTSLDYTKPRIDDSEIFAHDYTTLKGIVFAVLKLRDILRYHVQTNEEWQFLLLGVLDAACKYDPQKPLLLREAILPAKEYILCEMDRTNEKDMSAGLLLLDLLEKSPQIKQRKSQQEK